MTRTELYKLWAPDESIWTPWAKPVLFADSSFDNLPLGDTPGWRFLNLPWVPSLARETVVVADLPGLESVKAGMVLGHAGFRPVPLFNGAAGPMMGTFSGALPLVDVYPIIRALHSTAEELMTLRLLPDAPPVFLLDANRYHGGNVANPGRFDNRWCVFPQDFPSSNFLLSQNIRSILLVQEQPAQPQHDLAHVLLRWQEAGIQILSCGVSDEHPPAAMRVEKPNNFRALWYRAMVLAGLRRNSAGGFGAVIPMPSSGGGYG